MQLLGLWRLHRGRAPPPGPRLGQLMQLLARPLLQLLSRPLMQLCPGRLIAISILLAWPTPFLEFPVPLALLLAEFKRFCPLVHLNDAVLVQVVLLSALPSQLALGTSPRRKASS